MNRALVFSILVSLGSFLIGCDNDDNGGGNEPDLAQNEAKANFSGAVNGAIKSDGKPRLFIDGLGDYGIGYFLGWQSKSGDSVLLVVGGRDLPINTGEISFADPSTNYQNYPEQIAYAVTIYEGERWISNGSAGTITLTENNDSTMKGTINNAELNSQSTVGKTITLNGAFDVIKKISNAQIRITGAVNDNLKSVVEDRFQEGRRGTVFSYFLPSSDTGSVQPSQLTIGLFHEGELTRGTFKAVDSPGSTDPGQAAVNLSYSGRSWRLSEGGSIRVNTTNEEKITGKIKDFKI